MWALGNSNFSSLCACPQRTENATGISVGITNTIFASRWIAYMESTNNKDLLYFHRQGESPYLKFDTHTAAFSKVPFQWYNTAMKYIVVP